MWPFPDKLPLFGYSNFWLNKCGNIILSPNLYHVTAEKIDDKIQEMCRKWKAIHSDNLNHSLSWEKIKFFNQHDQIIKKNRWNFFSENKNLQLLAVNTKRHEETRIQANESIIQFPSNVVTRDYRKILRSHLHFGQAEADLFSLFSSFRLDSTCNSISGC